MLIYSSSLIRRILHNKISGCGAAGSALDWGSRGREFKSRHSDQKKTKSHDLVFFNEIRSYGTSEISSAHYLKTVLKDYFQIVDFKTIPVGTYIFHSIILRKI